VDASDAEIRVCDGGVMRVACAQIENEVGDLAGNRERILDAMAWAEAQHADVLVLPELALTGYPLSDLALRDDFIDASLAELSRIAERSGSTTTVLSTIDRVPPRRGVDTKERSVSIGAALLCDGDVRGWYHKVLLPTYETFEEGRYFVPGERPGQTWRIGPVVAGVSICEDAWSDDGPPEDQAAAGARILLIPNASPFHRGKDRGRLDLMRRVARRNSVPVVYVNLVGGQEDLVFDGGSIIVGADGELLHRAPAFVPDRFVADVPLAPVRPVTGRPATVHTRVGDRPGPAAPPVVTQRMDLLDQVWSALVLGTRDFVRHAGFDGGVVALSGGVDSALTTALAVDALGPDRVLALTMPGRTTSDDETEAARAVAAALRVELRLVPVTGLAGGDLLASALPRPVARLTEDDLDSRARAAVLMAVADELGRLALATGNKTELSIGAGVLFGDMAGGFSPLRDCPKTLVYELARACGRHGPALPPGAVESPPTVLGRADRLPGYDVLDEIVERYVERGEGVDEICAAGFDPVDVRGVLQLIDDAEFKRRQIAPGVKITARAYANDRRMPIANRWRPFVGDEPDLASASGRGT
jgi:NAD+ synthase (glutamine-hydrolysing)